MSAVVFTGVRVFDGRRSLEADSVVVENGVVTAVGRGLPGPAGAEVVDGGGRATLLPGLIDAHIHLMTPDPLGQSLRFGVTTALSMGDDEDLVRRLKAAQETDAGARLADLRSAGASAKAPGGHAAYGPLAGVPTVARAEDAEAFVAARVAAGADYIKIRYEDGQLLGRVAGRSLPTIDRETLVALVGAAHRHGKQVLVHIGTRQAALDALAAGADGLAHAFVDVPPDDEVVAAAAGRFLVPTLAVFRTLAGHFAEWRDLVTDPRVHDLATDADRALGQEADAGLPIDYAAAARTAGRFHRAGIPVLAGTDATGFLHGVGLWLELELLVAAGLRPIDALASATAVPAEIFGLADRGRIAPGQRADVLLVEGDPVTDVRALRALAGVWKQGRRTDRGAEPVTVTSPGPELTPELTPARPAGPADPGRVVVGGAFARTIRGQVGNFLTPALHRDGLVVFERDNDTWGFPWQSRRTLPVTGRAVGVVMAAGPDGALHALARVIGPAGAGFVHWTSAGEDWSDGQPLSGVPADGDPALTVGADGTLELIAADAGALISGRLPGGVWQPGQELTGPPGTAALGAVTAVRPDGGWELVGRFGGQLLTWCREPGEQQWRVTPPPPCGPVTGEPGVSCAADGGLDVVVVSGRTLVHWHRSAAGDWAEPVRLPEVRPYGPADRAPERFTVQRADLLLGGFGNLELLVRSEVPTGHVLVPFYRDHGNGEWSALPMVADGQKVFGDLSVWGNLLGRPVTAGGSTT
jgi:imidazolonepropionase-like amidohydrolase